MCVTANKAEIVGTRTYVYATSLAPDGSQPVHVCGYQNEAETLDGPNCMFLNFAGSDLRLVRGPEHTRSFMRDMTVDLPELVYVERTRGGGMLTFGGAKGLTVEEYGDYTVILAQGPADILSALDQVRPERRPAHSRQLEEMVNFYMSFFSNDAFVLACFDGKVKPHHPITVSYVPRNRNVLTIPGLDGHDGRVPVIGMPVHRDFSLAFAIAGHKSPYPVRYDDNVQGEFWAPSSVTGFIDNRRNGPNGDYIVPTEAVMAGLDYRELAETLR